MKQLHWEPAEGHKGFLLVGNEWWSIHELTATWLTIGGIHIHARVGRGRQHYEARVKDARYRAEGTGNPPLPHTRFKLTPMKTPHTTAARQVHLN